MHSSSGISLWWNIVPNALGWITILPFMMTSSNGNMFEITGHLCREFTDPGEFPTQRPVTRSFDDFFDLRLINRWVNNPGAGDLRRNRPHYEVIVMEIQVPALGSHNGTTATCWATAPHANIVMSTIINLSPSTTIVISIPFNSKM